jgi:hypothetical protein
LAIAEQTLTVLCPQLDLSPAVITQASQPRAIALRGTSFHPSTGLEGSVRPYVLTVDGTKVGDGVMDNAGAFTTSFPASGLVCGAHDVTVTEQEAGSPTRPAKIPPTAAADPVPSNPDGPLTVSTSLVVNCPSVITPQLPPGQVNAPRGTVTTPPNTTLDIEPQVVTAGMIADVTGTGFTPGHKVSLNWLLPAGGKQSACQGPVIANKDGVFVFRCLVPLHEQIGQRTMIATDGKHTAVAGALVISGSMQPAGRIGRNPRMVSRN